LCPGFIYFIFYFIINPYSYWCKFREMVGVPGNTINGQRVTSFDHHNSGTNSRMSRNRLYDCSSVIDSASVSTVTCSSSDPDPNTPSALNMSSCSSISDGTPAPVDPILEVQLSLAARVKKRAISAFIAGSLDSCHRKKLTRIIKEMAIPTPETLELLTDFDNDGHFDSQDYLEFSLMSLSD
jgi:hypothetical protein